MLQELDMHSKIKLNNMGWREMRQSLRRESQDSC